MNKHSLQVILLVTLTAALFLLGCVERKLTINTQPQEAVVTLNDEEVGLSPAMVSFNWYGDYNVRISKEGYETLKTHRKLKGPWYDYFPFDFFAQVLNSKRIVDSYEWTFELEPSREIGTNELINRADVLKAQLESN